MLANIKKVLFILTMVCLIFQLSSCAKSKTPGTTIKTDLQKLGLENLTIDSFCQGNGFTFNNYNITKRQTNPENKEDIIFCDVVLSDEFYNLTVQEKLVYNYYDQGGWILQTNSTVSKSIKAISAPNSSSVDNCLKNNKIEYRHNYRHIEYFFCTVEEYGNIYYSEVLYNNEKTEINFDEYELTEIKFDEKKQTASVNFKVWSNVLSANIIYNLKCDSEEGWISEKILDSKENKMFNSGNVLNFEYDYNAFVGKTYADSVGFLRIDSADDNSITLANWASYMSNIPNAKKYRFNPLASAVLNEYGYSKFRYIPGKNAWTDGSADYYKCVN